ncbi:VanZ family protein [Lachnoclostridium sp. Marseille-P6806]|uniref:VanZ family protein n=1 Tax=Lachnoclostridium sp. Marseille-P6806 TaxID=2364793 RepID=UPI0013EF194B|nr:VanZ family protein [Lachnoclostridium sp. Marseille-P6806]
MGRNDIQPAQLILCGIVLLCGYFIFLGKLLSRCRDRRAAPAIALTLFVIFGGVSAAVLYLSALLGGTELLLTGLLVAGSAFFFFRSLPTLLRSGKTIRREALLFLLLYVALIFSLTLLSRGEQQDRVIRMTNILSGPGRSEAFSSYWLRHAFRNVLLFVPFGVLVTFLDRKKPENFVPAAIGGLMLSAFIESVQLMLRLGQCDIMDIAANTAGAALGGWAVCLLSGVVHEKRR